MLPPASEPVDIGEEGTMGFVHRFEDQSRQLGKHDGAMETVKFARQLLLSVLTVAILLAVSWMLAGGDARVFLRSMSHYL
jgi:hypothetical protein